MNILVSPGWGKGTKVSFKGGNKTIYIFSVCSQAGEEYPVSTATTKNWLKFCIRQSDRAALDKYFYKIGKINQQ